MPVGRYLRGFNSFDLYGNLIPGIITLVITLGVYPDPPIPSTIEQYALFVVIAYLVGGIIQAWASKAVGSRKHFDQTMSSAEERTESELAETDVDDDTSTESDEGHTIGDADGWCWKIGHPFVGPLFYWLRPGRGEELDDKILANRIWQYLVDTHEIPFRTTSYSVLYHVMSSRVDNIQSPSRAVRMQALRNLNRGMWITSWYAAVVIAFLGLIDWTYEQGDMLPLINHTYQQPFYFEYWLPMGLLFVLSLIGILFFWFQAESSEEDYIEYLFADYVVAVASEAEDISFAEDTSLEITGESTVNLKQLFELADSPSQQENPTEDPAEDK